MKYDKILVFNEVSLKDSGSWVTYVRRWTKWEVWIFYWTILSFGFGGLLGFWLTYLAFLVLPVRGKCAQCEYIFLKKLRQLFLKIFFHKTLHFRSELSNSSASMWSCLAILVPPPQFARPVLTCYTTLSLNWRRQGNAFRASTWRYNLFMKARPRSGINFREQYVQWALKVYSVPIWMWF
jgi:hypothetical protein